jgi:hypothetical protein
VAFYTDFVEMFDSFDTLFVERWNGLPAPTRIFIALTIAIGLLYVGSRSEQAGWSTILMLSALGLFIYLVVLGYALVH